MPHFKALGIMNLQYEIRNYHKFIIKAQVTIFLSGTDVMIPIHFSPLVLHVFTTIINQERDKNAARGKQ